MLAHFLALAVAIGSIALYLVAFFIPEIHRKKDFIWSGVGLFYALMLWVFSGRITGGLFLGHLASVALLGWFGWQTLELRRQLTPEGQKTPVPSMGTLQTNIQEQFEKLSISEKLTQLVSTITNTFSAKKAEIQQKQNVTASGTESTTLDKAAIDAIADAENTTESPKVTEVAEVKVEPPLEQIATAAEEKVEVTSSETNVGFTTSEETEKTTTEKVEPETTEVTNELKAPNNIGFTIVTPDTEEIEPPEPPVNTNTLEESVETTIYEPHVEKEVENAKLENTEAEKESEVIDTTEFTIATPGGKEVSNSEVKVTKDTPSWLEQIDDDIEEATFIQIDPEDKSPEKRRPDYPTF